jgi:UDP-N-acetylglucosamine--N-acetylmuramyl-(pentapeptide) pyrophosphoryl-undecaprenol N-acetylglucosamine transferase
VKPIVIAAGGTGGHFFPAEALAAALIERGHRIALMADARSGGLRSDVFAGRETFTLLGAGIAGRGLIRGAAAALALGAGVAQAREILGGLDAAIVVGFGGYPSVAPVLGARLMKRRRRPPVILHEQNAVLGRANRFLARRATALALSFEQTERVPESAQTVTTGNPVRPAIAALASLPYVPPGETIRLFVFGGSLGARVLSDVVPPAICALPEALRMRISVVQQCRGEDLQRVRRIYARNGIEAELWAFFPDVAERLAAAHLVIARAGASTVAELAVVGRPAVLVPLPGAIDDHQSANAGALARAGAAWLMPQHQLTEEGLSAQLLSVLTGRGVLARAAAAARTEARPDAAARLADLVEALMRQEARS